jgi:hypothetical protein
VAHACHHTYLGDSDQEDHNSRPAQADHSQDSSAKIATAKQTGGMAQVVEYLLCKQQSPEFKTTVPQTHKNSLLVKLVKCPDNN